MSTEAMNFVGKEQKLSKADGGRRLISAERSLLPPPFECMLWEELTK
jgi:hypothetical protein